MAKFPRPASVGGRGEFAPAIWTEKNVAGEVVVMEIEISTGSKYFRIKIERTFLLCVLALLTARGFDGGRRRVGRRAARPLDSRPLTSVKLALDRRQC